jgi:diguanylate cyclase (GGDEF)-like protein
VLQDAVEAPLMKAVRHSLAGIDLKSILVFPVFSKDKVVGTLHLRTQSRRQLSGKEIRVAEVLSVIAADAIKAVIKEERLREMYKAAEKKVVIDDLTGLYNRRFLNIRLEEEFNMSQRHGLPLSCIMFDIDHFKSINDTLGHREGDRVLRRFSACLREKVRISDIISRYGGEEFVLLLPVTDASGAMREAVRMKSCLDSLDFGPRLVAVTASIGIASYPYPGVRTHEDLIRNADEAMYEAKRKGRDRIETFDEALSRSHMTAG